MPSVRFWKTLKKRKSNSVRCLKCMRLGPQWRFKKLVYDNGLTYGYRCRFRCMK